MASFFSKYCLPVFVAGILVSCSSIVYHSVWQSPPIKADGNPNEWGGPLKLFDSGNNLYYSVSNDLDNLYIRIKTNDRQTQMRILSSGIQFWIDTTGKNKELIGAQFPLTIKPKKRTTSSYRENRDTIISRKSPDLASLKSQYQKEDKRIHLSGFIPPAGGILPMPNDFGIDFNIGWDTTNVMIYEAAIPFRTFFKTSLTSADSTKIFGISIDIGALPLGALDGMGARPGMMGGMGMGGGMGIGMGGMGMGGMGFGMRIPLGGGGPGNSGYSYDSTIKMKIKLAVKSSQ